MQQIWKTQQWPKDWTRSTFILIPKKGNAKEFLQYSTISLISHASKIMLTILQARRQQYMNQELLDVHARFKKGRGTRDQIANTCCIIEKTREFQKNILCFIDYTKTFVWITTNGGKLNMMGILDHLICLLRNLYAGQEVTCFLIWTWNNELVPNWERSILSPCLFNLYAEHIMGNAGQSTTAPKMQYLSLSDLVSSVCMPRSGIAGSYGRSISIFFKKSPHCSP